MVDLGGKVYFLIRRFRPLKTPAHVDLQILPKNEQVPSAHRQPRDGIQQPETSQPDPANPPIPLTCKRCPWRYHNMPDKVKLYRTIYGALHFIVRGIIVTFYSHAVYLYL